MRFLKLAIGSLRFYWRSNLGVLLAVVVSTAVLTGALVVGDSVRYSLVRTANARLGTTDFALVGNDRFFRVELAGELAEELKTTVASVLQAKGLVSDSGGDRWANRVEIYGVDERFYALGAAVNPFADWGEGVVLSQPLAKRLGAAAGDQIVLRIGKPSLMPRDIPLTPDSDLSAAFRLRVNALAGKSAFGRFGLRANQIWPSNVFVPLRWLQEKLGRTGQANMLLVAKHVEEDITAEAVNEAFQKSWQLPDAGLELRKLKRQQALELRSSRVFIDESLADAAANNFADATLILTYFVNELRLGDRTTPHSMVTAISKSKDPNSLIPLDMRDDEILINQWLADDLGAKPADAIELTYFVVGPMRKLVEEKREFRVRAVVPLEDLAADPNLMPDFPGLSDVENCRDWKPGVPIDLDKIRPRDEDYWNKYKGTPKAFVTLSAGQSMWRNRYGSLTAVRYPLHTGAEARVAEGLLKSADPASVGLFFQPVRDSGLKAADQATDFGWLFLGFSLFLIGAAIVLMGLLFVFGVENRADQMGMLKAVGFPPSSIGRLLLLEGSVLSVLGGIGGVAAGLLYTKAMVYGLATVWSVAVSGAKISFHAEPSTLFIGAAAGVSISLLAIWLTVRSLLRRPARELLSGLLTWQFFGVGRVSKGRAGLLIAVVAAAGAGVLLVVMVIGNSFAQAAAFLGAGTLLLVAGLGLVHFFLTVSSGGLNQPVESLRGLGFRNSARRRGRSLTVVGLLACGVFLVIAVGANKHDPLAHAHRRDSGTGGFALFGETSISVLHDLNAEQGRKSLGLDGSKLAGVDVVQMRVHEGDDASCFNLNRAQNPRLLGVQPEQLRRRRAFSFVKAIEGGEIENGWNLLEGDYGDNVVPAIGDKTTITWALGKSVGDEIQYADSKGRKFKVLLVGRLENSILQGSLIIAEDKFIERFPDEEGYRVFLIDASEKSSEAVSGVLSRGLRDFGLELVPVWERLAAFSAVENTYLSIFQMLGGLGLVLGSVGLGLVVLRNVLDRRGELAMLGAIGFDKDALKRMVFYEHGGLMACGLVVGVAAALVAVSPAIGSPGAELPYLSLALTVTAMGVSGLVWIWIAAVFALSGKMLDALRNE